MPRRVLRSLCLTLLLAGAALPAAAHDLWLVPEETVAPGKPVRLRANVGMDFPKSEHAPDPAAFKRRLLIKPDGSEGVLLAAGKDGASGLLEFVPEQPGVYVAAVETRPKQIALPAERFNEYLV